MKQYVASILVEKCLDITFYAENDEDAERRVKEEWEDLDIELDYGTQLTIDFITCLEDEEEE